MNIKEKIKMEKNQYKSENNLKKRIYNFLIKHIDYSIYKTKIYARYYRYFKDKNNKLMMFYFGKKYFKYSSKYNLELYSDFGSNFKIFHPNIVINKNAIIGNDVRMHGNNCIGNNGINDKAPQIGNNVDIGFGACIIGDVIIADNIIIGANSIVTKSFTEEGVVIAGNPATIKKYKLK